MAETPRPGPPAAAFIPEVKRTVAVSSGKGGVGKSTVAVNLALALKHKGHSVGLVDVMWGPLDYLVFDMPPGTGDAQLSLSQVIPLGGVVMVTTPQEVALLDVRKALAMFRKLNVPILGIVENMSYFLAPDTGARYAIFGEGGGDRVAEEF